MRLWWIALVAGVVIVGCGGANSGTPPNNTTGGTTGTPPVFAFVPPSFTLASDGEVQYTVLSGQGRQVGSLVAVIRNTEFQDSIGLIPTIFQNNLPDIRIQLDGYSHNARTFGVNVPDTQQTRHFLDYDLEIYRLEEITDDNGNTQNLISQIPALEVSGIPVDLRVFPGRQTSIQLRLDDAMIQYDGIDLIFDQDLFEDRNFSPDGEIEAFLSDYISFDLTAMPAADRPPMSNGAPADAVLFSGDAIALRKGFGTQGSFELLQPVQIAQGFINPGPSLGGGNAPGSYTLLQNDPRDLTEQAKIVALRGIWRNFTDVFQNVAEFTFLALPTSHDIDDDSEITNEQQVVMFRWSGGAVVSMWQGKVVYQDTNGDGKPDQGTFNVWPIQQVTSASADNQVDGVVSNLVVVQDTADANKWNVKSGKLKITTNLPSGYPADGSFVVFRR